MYVYPPIQRGISISSTSTNVSSDMTEMTQKEGMDPRCNKKQCLPKAIKLMETSKKFPKKSRLKQNEMSIFWPIQVLQVRCNFPSWRTHKARGQTKMLKKQKRCKVTSVSNPQSLSAFICRLDKI